VPSRTSSRTSQTSPSYSRKSSLPSLAGAAEAARRRLGLRQLSTLSQRTPNLRDFIPELSRGYQPPLHLLPALERFERFETEPFRFVLSVPPRHGKTELVLHFIAWALRKHPWLDIGYATYNQDAADTQSYRCQALVEAAGVRLARSSAAEWGTTENRYCVFSGIPGNFIGKGFHVLFVDDPYAGRAAAESKVVRDRVEASWRGDLRTRVQRQVMRGVTCGSVCEIQTRWHEEDLAGYLTRGGSPSQGIAFKPFEYVRLQAISNEGEEERERALWPEGGWTLDVMRETRGEVGAYEWASGYQGEPRPRGAKVFQDVWTFQALPPQGYRHAIGLDLAYSSKTSSDKSVALAMLRGQKDGLNYLVDVERAQVSAPAFKRTVGALQRRHPGARVRWYCAGPERGSADFFVQAPDAVRHFEALPATSDKFIRAQPVAAAWNRGDVLCQEGAPWLPEFLRVVNGFTGHNDSEDDDVDALAAAFDLLDDPRSANVALGSSISAPRRT
jgi:predicted phage terminase large subunit-like protein